MASRKKPHRDERLRSIRSRASPRRAVEKLERRRLLTSGYLTMNLVSDQPGTALVQDAQVINPWGLALNANGGDLWIADSGSGLAALYAGAVGGSPSQPSSPFGPDTPVVGIPSGNATGITPNGSTSFVVSSNGAFGPASFLLASTGGQISGYNRFVPSPAPSTQAQLAASTTGAAYTGLTMANNAGQNFLYAADFHDNRIDVFDASFHSVTASGGFTDANLPAGFAPYNIVNLAGQLYVSYAKQDAAGQNPVAGPGNGFVDVFDLNGVLEKELIVGQPGNPASPLNAPWAIVQAPSTSFGDFSGDLLVGNHGDGLIHAFNPQTGALVGTMTTPAGQALVIDGLHGLAFGNGLSTGSANELLYSAGPSGGSHGLLGAIQSAQGVSLVAQGSVIATTANQAFNGTLAVFTDSQNLSPGSFSATINWGDGSSTTGGISALADGGFAVIGSHSYFTSGAKSVTIQIRDSLNNTATASALAQVATAGLAMTGLTFTPTEAAAFNGAVATFTDGDGNTSPLAYQATIVWGDGSTTAGSVTFTAGKFTVLGTHTYADEGTDTALVTISDFDGTSASVNSTAKVADAPLSGTNSSIAGTLDTTFNGAVATFTDGNPNATLGEFSATIDWGDGTTTAGVVTAGLGAAFSVAGSHAYLEAGPNTVTVTINDVGGSQAVVADNATVTDIDALGATLAGIAPTEGTLFTGTVAAVVDTNLATTIGELAATIDWGDGTTTSGTLAGAAGVFAVAGDHTYVDEGLYPLTVTVAHVGGTASATAVGTITVADTGTLAVSGAAVAATEGATYSGQVATASDTYAAPAAGFTATIDWGDGTLSDGTVSGSNGQFTISGDHVYVEEGTYSPVVSMADLAPGSISATGTSTAVVGDAGLSAAGTTLDLTEGQAFTGTVVNFDDANPFGAAGDFTATIDWGDGTVSAGTVSSTGGFQISGTHTYAVGGTYDAAVTIVDDGGSTAVATSTMLVADYPLIAAGVSVSGGEGQTFSGAVATFTDTNPDGGELLDYSATIAWGDGGTSAGTITGSAGHYTVGGIHAFSDVCDAVSIVVNDIGGASATATAAADVSDANSFTPFGSTLSTTEGQTLSGTLATFADTYSGNPASDFSASVDWGDGQTTNATVTGQSGEFTVNGTHVYAEAGRYTAQVILAHNAPGTAHATAAATINAADARLTASGVSLLLTEGEKFTGTVASLIDADTLSTAADFTATIAWGDGTSSTPGGVTQTAAGTFVVTGTHLYADEAADRPISVMINDVGGRQATAASAAKVADAPLTSAALTITATEGASFDGQVATFTDANPNATAADFTATIAWGDGTSPTAGTVTASADGGFSVTGSHTYADEAKSLPLTVTINDRGGSSATAASTAIVADAPVTASKVTFTATEGLSFSGAVATFTDGNPAARVDDFTATIAWGDGTSAIVGVVSLTSNGGFVVTGTHTYAEKATRQVTVTVHDVGGSGDATTSTADVLDAPLSPDAPLTLNATQGVLFSGTLGTFTDANANGAKSDFTATIDWGDGSATTTGVILTAPGEFIVSGSHAYANPSAGYAVKIAVADVDGAQTTVLASVHVASTRFSASGATVTAIEGTVFSGAVAACDDTDPNAADYSATINWGDGTTTAASIAAAPGGGFLVNGTHVFTGAGTDQVTVVVTNPSLDKLTVNGRANVADAPLTAAGTTVAATRGIAFSGTVATFTDADANGAVADYSATIVWGDGATSLGAIATAPGGGFAVVGSHTYANEAQDLGVSVTVSDVGGSRTTASSTANVSEAPLDIVAANVTVPPGGTVAGQLLATFTDLGGAQPLADYAATIDWGDGSSQTSGSIAATNSGFQITGSHQYLLPGNHNIHVSVREVASSTAATTDAVSVPPSANQLYVEAAYLDVLDRAVDNPSLILWSAQLDAGGPRNVLVDTIDHSAEYFGNIIIAPAYERYLGRASDPAGLAYWVDQMQNHGLTDERLEAGFIGSPEFYAHAGGTDKSWVDAMYEDLLGRPADPAGEAYWIAQLAAGASRASVAYGFAASQERESQRITDDYMHYLGRQPDQQGLNFWLGQFLDGFANEGLITGFVASDEYYQKHTS